MLGIRDVAAVRDECVFAHREDTLYIFESGKTPKARCRQNIGELVPRLSAARTMPSLYFMPSTLVPTIFGFWVCWTGALLMGICRGSVDGWKDGFTGCIGSTFWKNDMVRWIVRESMLTRLFHRCNCCQNDN
jgi:hypothetical protein